MSMIKVRYVGKGDCITTEYDGIKYSFSHSKPVQIIPLAVYNYFQSDSNPYRSYLVPVTEAAEEAKAEKKQTISSEIDSIEKDLKKDAQVKPRINKRK